jgi:signal peptidase I
MYFALFMVVILLVTGFVWLLDIVVLRKKRLGGVDEPWYVEYAKSFFPVILLVFTLRSMMPTLLAGDYILVNKFTYGLRVPILNNTFFETGHPNRGDVFVFHYPPEPTIDYIKRVVGLPGDKIQYQDKHLIINGKVLDVKFEDNYEYEMQGANIISARRSIEQLGDVPHDILIHDIPNQYNDDAPGAKLQAGETITVPEGNYFAMGDNRDNSADSRVWGFVPEKNLVGKAFFIWMNIDKFGRIGTSIK